MVVGISRDGPAAQSKFKEKFRLPFPLLCDEATETMKAFGVWKEKNMYGKKVMGCERTTVVINPEGRVTRVFAKVKVDGHARAVLETIGS